MLCYRVSYMMYRYHRSLWEEPQGIRVQPINVPTHTRYGMDKSIDDKLAAWRTKRITLKEKIDTGRTVLEEKNQELEESERLRDEMGRECMRKRRECEELERELTDMYDTDVDIARKVFRLETTR